MKVCTRCNEAKEKSQFAGRWNRSEFCLECYPLHRAERRDPDNNRHSRDYARRHPERRAQKAKAYWAAHPDARMVAYRRYAEKHQDRLFARKVMSLAIKTGRLVPQPCWCGDPVTQGHHVNGYDPEHYLDVAWLCRVHHMEQHRKY